MFEFELDSAVYQYISLLLTRILLTDTNVKYLQKTRKFERICEPKLVKR